MIYFYACAPRNPGSYADPGEQDTTDSSPFIDADYLPLMFFFEINEAIKTVMHKQNNIENAFPSLLTAPNPEFIEYSIKTISCNKKHSKEISPKYLSSPFLNIDDIIPFPKPNIIRRKQLGINQ